MSTIKTDRLSSTHIPLPQVDGITEVELFVAAAGQVNFDLTAINNSMRIRVFVGMDEATWSWVDSNTITVTAPTIIAGAKVRVYKVFGDIAYKPMSFFDAYALKTDNVASASKLQVARTINGVSFDGTANITIAVPSKLPLAGGTLTGPLTAPTDLVQYAQEKVQDLGTGSGTRTVTVTNGAYLQATANGEAATWNFTIAPTSGYATAWTLELTNGGQSAQTFTGVLWAGGTAPTLTANGTDVLVFTKVGSTVRGYLAAGDSK